MTDDESRIVQSMHCAALQFPVRLDWFARVAAPSRSRHPTAWPFPRNLTRPESLAGALLSQHCVNTAGEKVTWALETDI